MTAAGLGTLNTTALTLEALAARGPAVRRSGRRLLAVGTRPRRPQQRRRPARHGAARSAWCPRAPRGDARDWLGPALGGTFDADRFAGPVVSLVERDRAVVWHPYASVVRPSPLYPVVEARGTRLVLEDGRELVDGMSSWWAAIHGYRHPVLDAALHAQVDRFSHVMFGGLTHEPAVAAGRDARRHHARPADAGSSSATRAASRSRSP